MAEDFPLFLSSHPTCSVHHVTSVSLSPNVIESVHISPLPVTKTPLYLLKHSPCSWQLMGHVVKLLHMAVCVSLTTLEKGCGFIMCSVCHRQVQISCLYLQELEMASGLFIEMMVFLPCCGEVMIGNAELLKHMGCMF